MNSMQSAAPSVRARTTSPLTLSATHDSSVVHAGGELRVAIDVGCTRHRVAIGLASGALLDEFDVAHSGPGLSEFFTRVERHEARHEATSVAVAMEGFGGYARPLDARVLTHGWRLYNVNNLKFARFKEIFPAPAKTDAIDAKRMLELFQLRESVPMAKAVLQEVARVGEVEAELKVLTRRRKQLVDDRKRLVMRMQADLHATCPGLLEITGEADNLWFLNLLTLRADLRQLRTVRHATLLGIAQVGKAYAEKIRQWQREASFAASTAYMGAMIVADARQMLALRAQIMLLEKQIGSLSSQSVMATRIKTVPGFGLICGAELAAEIGNIERFAKADSLAMYLGVAPLDNSSGKYHGVKIPRQINRRARNAMMIAAVKHCTSVPASKAYFDKKMAAGKTHQQAVRAVARMLAKILFAMLKHQIDYHQPADPNPTKIA
jgi:transposase